MSVRILLHSPTYIKGEPVEAGTLVEVDEDTAARLRIRGDIVGPDYVHPAPDEAQNGDPNPENADPKAENRDPGTSKKKSK